MDWFRVWYLGGFGFGFFIVGVICVVYGGVLIVWNCIGGGLEVVVLIN